MAKAATAIDTDALADAIKSGDIDGAARIAQITPEQMFQVSEAVRGIYFASGQAVAQQLPLALRATFGFGGNARAVQQVQEITGHLITNVLATQREAITVATQELIARVANEGIPAKAAALEIVGTINRATGMREGGYLGLDLPRAAQAAKVAAMLRDPKQIADYFLPNGKPRYTTTDRRFDATVRKAIAEGRAVSEDTATKLTKAHRARLLKNRADTISRTETLNALRAGERAGFQKLVDSGTVDDSRVIRGWIPTMDNRTRPDHAEMAGQVQRGMATPFTFPGGSMAMFPGDSSLSAPAAELIQCFHPETLISRVGILQAMRRDYCGDMVELTAGLDIKLSVTVNHPVLTGRGWVPAGEVKEGDKLFHCQFGNFGGVPAGSDIKDMQASAEQLYNAAKVMGREMRLAGLVMDFHGDGSNQDVNIVAMPRRLGDALNPTGGQVVHDFLFARADVALGKCIAVRMNLARMAVFTKLARGIMGRLSAGLAKIWGKQSGAAAVPFAQSGLLNTHISQALPNGGATNSNCLSNGEDGLAEVIFPANCFKVGSAAALPAPKQRRSEQFAVSAVGGLNPQILEAGTNYWNSQPSGALQAYDTRFSLKRFLNGFMMFLAGNGPVIRPAVARNIRRFHYDGPVYNFTSETNVLVANGIVNHNCRCMMSYRLAKQGKS